MLCTTTLQMVHFPLAQVSCFLGSQKWNALVTKDYVSHAFRSPKLEDLRKLGRLIADPEAFMAKYGGLLSLLKVNMMEGVLSTLVQFYDPVYHCFTFPDYQLTPTLEEYSQLIDLPIIN